MTNAYTLRNHFTLGNYTTTITRADFGMDINEFLCKWTKAGVTHHAALALGHCGSMVEKFGSLMGIPVEKIV